MKSNFMVVGGRDTKRKWWQVLLNALFGTQSSVVLTTDEDFEIEFWQHGIEHPLIVRGYRSRGGQLTMTVENKGSPYLKRHSTERNHKNKLFDSNKMSGGQA